MYKLLTKKRVELGMTIEELAIKANVPKNTVAKICSGITKNPRISTLKSIAQTLGLTLNDLNYYEQAEVESQSNQDISDEGLQYGRDYDHLDEDLRRLARGFMNILLQSQLTRL